MLDIRTFPTESDLEQASEGTPPYMRPSVVPYAVILEGFLSDSQCDAIQTNLGALEPYSFGGCGAVTRECASDPSLDPVERAVQDINALWFQYLIDEGQHSWMQTYEKGGAYQRHMDASPGQTRKLTAVVMLSSPEDYAGGNLSFYVRPKMTTAPRTRGTLVVFQSWVEHEVSEVISGSRQTLNMGFWGPSFK